MYNQNKFINYILDTIFIYLYALLIGKFNHIKIIHKTHPNLPIIKNIWAAP